MVSFSKLAELSSGNIGFSGGAAIDTMPDLSLTECMDEFTMFLHESAIESYQAEETQDDQLFESALQAIAAHDVAIFESAVSVLNEAENKAGVWEGIKAKWAKIVEFFKSLVAKITSWVDAIAKDGPAFYAKYKTKFAESNKSVELKKWYDFDGLDKVDIKNVTANAILEKVGVKMLASDITPESAKAETEALGKIERDTIKKAVAEMIGMPEDAKNYQAYLCGKEGTHTASKSDDTFIKNTLLNADVKTMKGEFSNMAKAAEEQNRIVAAQMGKDNDAGDLAKYVKKYTDIYNAAASEANKLMTAVVKATKLRISQAKRAMRSVIIGKDVGGAESATPADNGAEGTTPEGEATQESFGVNFSDFEFEF